LEQVWNVNITDGDYNDATEQVQSDFESANTILLSTVCNEFEYAGSTFQQGSYNDLFEQVTSELTSGILDLRRDILVEVAGTRDTVEIMESALEVMSELNNYTEYDLPKLVDDWQELSDEQLASWTSGSYAFFAFVFFAMIVAVICAIAFATPCENDDKIAHALLHCSWFFSWIFATVLFLFCGLIIPVAIIFSDTCTVMADVPSDIDGYLGHTLSCNSSLYNSTAETGIPDACLIMDSCFNGGLNATYFNILVAPYIDDGLIKEFEFPDLPSINETLTQQWIEPLESELDQFEANCATTSNQRDTLNFLRVSLATYDRMMWYAEGKIYENYLLKVVISEEYDQLKADKNDCAFTRVYYDDSVDALCSTSLEGIAGTVLCMFFVALCGWPQIIMSVYVSIRNFGSGQGKGSTAIVAPIDMVGIGGPDSKLPDSI